MKSLIAPILTILIVCAMTKSCVDGMVSTAEIQEQYYSMPLTVEQQQFKAFFEKHNSPRPVEMAIAVTQTKRPALMAAVAVIESNGNPKAVGDGGDSKGAFQVQEKHWGKVPKDAASQALQAERILESLVASNARRSLRYGLTRYNGGSNPPRAAKRYAQRVISLTRKIERGHGWEKQKRIHVTQL